METVTMYADQLKKGQARLQSINRIKAGLTNQRLAHDLRLADLDPDDVIVWAIEKRQQLDALEALRVMHNQAEHLVDDLRKKAAAETRNNETRASGGRNFI